MTSSATAPGPRRARRELLRRVPVAEPVRSRRRRGRAGRAQGVPPGRGREFEVERLGAGGFRVTGEAVDRLIARHDVENEEALAHVEQRLHRIGVIRALEAAGFEPGDDVEIGGIVFELDPGAPL